MAVVGWIHLQFALSGSPTQEKNCSFEQLFSKSHTAEVFAPVPATGFDSKKENRNHKKQARKPTDNQPLPDFG
jgi:hypothetical protein